MNQYEKKGATFELGVAHRLHRLGDSVVISQFPVFSFSLRRLTPIDIFVLASNHVIVLELKGFSSRLSGTHSDRNWVGTSYFRNYQIFNPVIQTKEKVRSLQRKFRERGLSIGDFVWDYYVVVPKACKIQADRSIVKSDEEILLFVGGIILGCPRYDENVIKTLLTGVM